MKCPFCESEDGQKTIKSWKYQQVVVTRVKCKCGKFFQKYAAKSGKNWTIPKKTN